jgi:hypothetical protein
VLLPNALFAAPLPQILLNATAMKNIFMMVMLAKVLFA